MNWILGLATFASSVAAVIAWLAKLRWSDEFRSATDQLVRAKEAEISALKTRIESLEAVTSGRLLEHAATTKLELERIIADNDAKLSAAGGTIDGLKQELQRLKASGAAAAAQPGVAVQPSPGERNRVRRLQHAQELQARREILEAQLARVANERDALARANDRAARAHGELAAAEAALQSARAAWRRDLEEAQGKLRHYQDRAQELQEQIRGIREAGPDGACPTCDRPLASEYDQAVARMQREWEHLVHDGKSLGTRLDQLRATPGAVVQAEGAVATARKELDQALMEVSRGREMAAELEHVQAELKGLLERERLPMAQA